MRRSAGFVVLSVASIVALAADVGSVARPYIEVGDCWSYRTENFDNRGPIGEYELCVTNIDRQKDVIQALAVLKSNGREIDTSSTAEWGSRVSVNGNITPQGATFLKFPLRVGDAYSVETEFRRALLGENAGKIRWNLTVVGWQDVVVPAGKFRALKVEAHGTVTRYDVRTEIPVRTEMWYVPEVNRHVKYVFETSSERRSEELTGYKLNK